jgi:histidine ammonia-lyase
VHHGKETTAPAAFQEAGLEALEFQAKEALAVVNAGSCASAYAACNLFQANLAALLTQVKTIDRR